MTEDEVRARFRFASEPLKKLSIGDLMDLMVAHAAGEMSGGFLRQITGLDGTAIDFLYHDALARAVEICKAYRDSEEARFQATYTGGVHDRLPVQPE